MFEKRENESQKSNRSCSLKALPSYLHPFIVEQNYERYTARDHAVWRFIMRQAREIFKTKAHAIYLDGLSKTGIPISRIPNINEMNETLQKFSWGAICVRGFIPPQIFLEFFAHKVLPIAADMRTLEHIAYTPAPDIVHEAAGHAPIVADKAYADFLERFGKIASKAIYSDEDIRLYEAIRVLSDIKENPDSHSKEIEKAEENLKKTASSITWDSEASKLARMFWWTAEYGLVNSKSGPKIYGAGLLSSLGESQSCLDDPVEKRRLSTDCTLQSYDITRPQPQLFVADNFIQLREVLEEFDKTLSYHRGDKKSLGFALKSKSMTTTIFDTGFSLSGTLSSFKEIHDLDGYELTWTAPLQVCCDGCAEGEKIRKGVSEFRVLCGKDLSQYSGDKEIFDKIIEGSVVSIYGGACDRENFDFSEQGVSESTPARTSPFTEKEKEAFSAYKEIRKLRDDWSEGLTTVEKAQETLLELSKRFKSKLPDEWLLGLEIYEFMEIVSLSQKSTSNYEQKTFKEFLLSSSSKEQVKEFLEKGIKLASEKDHDPLSLRLY